MIKVIKRKHLNRSYRMVVFGLHCHDKKNSHWPIYRVAQKNNTETNQNDTDTNDIFGTNLILCKDIK